MLRYLMLAIQNCISKSLRAYMTFINSCPVKLEYLEIYNNKYHCTLITIFTLCLCGMSGYVKPGTFRTSGLRHISDTQLFHPYVMTKYVFYFALGSGINWNIRSGGKRTFESCKKEINITSVPYVYLIYIICTYQTYSTSSIILYKEK